MTILNKLHSALSKQKQRLKSAITYSSTIAPSVAVEEKWSFEPPNPPTREEAEAFVKKYSFWYHRIYLGNGAYTMPPTMADQVWALIKPTFPADLKGASMLDMGCNAGFFSILAKLRGAGRILGIEFLDVYLEQFEYIRKIWQMDIEYRLMDAHDIGKIDEQFDLVMKFYEREELNGDGSNWWAPDTECLLGMLRVAGFKYFSRPIYHAPSRILLIATKNEQSLLDWRKL